jgi:hypothetical protein
VASQHTGCKECPAYCRSANCLNRLHTAAADTIEALQKRIAELEEERRWIPVTERMPDEHDSYFAKFHGTSRWESCMFRTESDWVLANVVYQDGKSVVRELRTTDGGWALGHAYGVKAVTHWRPMPEPAKEG